MIWFRAALLAVVAGLAVAAVTQIKPFSPPEVATPSPEVVTTTPRPTRVPLPTMPREVIISRVSRDTPVPIAAPTQTADPSVEIVDYGYSPGQITINVGATVTWTNDGSDGHDVAGDGPGGIWRSGPLAPMQRYARTFDLPGTYDYACSFHPEMRGRVVVVQP